MPQPSYEENTVAMYMCFCFQDSKGYASPKYAIKRLEVFKILVYLSKLYWIIIFKQCKF